MSRYKVSPYILNVYIADGFADDCDELIHRCMQLSTLSYEKFCKVWKDLNFAGIFYERQSSAELAELSEEVIHIAKHYMVKSNFNFEETVAGLFLLYGLLNLQPFTNFASVRFVPDDVPALQRIEEVARKTRRQDVLYILGCVIIKGGHFHASERERGLEFPIRKYWEGMSIMDRDGARPTGVFFRQNEELDIMKDLGRLGKLYKDAKDSLGVTDKKSINYVDENLAEELELSLRRIIVGCIDDKTDDDDDDDESKPREHILSIKDRAMKNTVQPMRHLVSSQEKKKNRKKTSPTKKNQGKQSMKKSGKRIGPRKKMGRKTRAPSSSDSDDDDISISGSDDDETLDDETLDDEFENDETVEQDTGEGVQSLPLLTNEDQGSPFEIEFIDLQSSTSFEGNVKCDPEKKKKEDNTEEVGSREARIKNGDKTTREVTKLYQVDDDFDSETFKKPILDALILKRLEKRDLKRPRIKDKFKKQGMLAVANFKVGNTSKKTKR